MVPQLCPILQSALWNNYKRQRSQPTKGQAQNFTEGYFVVITKGDFYAHEKQYPRLQGPKRIVLSVNE